MASVIGTVTKIVGIAIVVDEQGKRHLLKQGEQLHDGDRVITSEGTTVTVAYAGGGNATLQPSQTIKMTDQLVPDVTADASENAVNMAVFKQIIAAINSGQDITELLDAAAAGVIEGEGNASFVNLDRILTDVNETNFILGGSSPADFDSSINNNLRYLTSSSSTLTSDTPPITKVQITIDTPVVSGNVLGQIGGTVKEVDNSVSLVNANAIAGVLTDSNSLVDNSHSLVNAGALAGVLSGNTSVTDNSLSLVNAGVVSGVLSDSTSVNDKSLSVVNAGVVPNLLSGNTSVTDQSTSLVNTGIAGGLLSDHTNVTNQSNSLVNANVVPGLLSGNSTVTDQSNNLVNVDVVPSVLSGTATVKDQSNSPVDVDVPLTVLSQNGTVVGSGIAADVLGAGVEAPLQPNNLIKVTSTDLDPSVLLKDQGTPDPVNVTTTVLDGTVGEIINPATPLSAGDVLGVENVIEPGLNLEKFTNTTTADSEALTLVNPPLAVNTLLVEQNLLNLH